MKKKCSKCSGKGGTSEKVKNRWGIEEWVMVKCIECMDTGKIYTNSLFTRIKEDKNKSMRG